MPEPLRNDNVPDTAQWLAGEGAGSWFYLEPTNNSKFRITRFSPTGEIECTGLFFVSNNLPFSASQNFSFEHLSHCKKVSILQNDCLVKLLRLDD
ncbi:MAG: hypothetical protein IPM42_02145 [Saprospiraceae bacterium]|nr:hypothetical protein [Saprospiraceae bacterium]